MEGQTGIIFHYAPLKISIPDASSEWDILEPVYLIIYIWLIL
jgi:hypothetical protein